MHKNLLTGEGNPFKIPSDIQLFEKGYNFGDQSARYIFLNIYGYCPCVIESNIIYDDRLLEHFRKTGSLICDETFLEENTQSPIQVSSDELIFEEERKRYIAYFSYKECIIAIDKVRNRLNSENASNLFKITVFHRPGTTFDLTAFDKYRAEKEEGSFITTIIKGDAGIEFVPFKVEIPKTFDITTNFEPDFQDVYKSILENLDQKKSGLYLFHGPPGVGKSTLIKHLASQIKREMIYVPIAFIDSLTDPGFIPSLLNKKGSVIVIEDAEKALLTRESDESSSSLVSTILNITDGIMGDIFKISIIATYNSPKKLIDKALVRKGRLKVEYEFKNLSVPTAQKLIDSLNVNYKVAKPMSLGDIFNLSEKDPIQDKSIVEEKVIGFGA